MADNTPIEWARHPVTGRGATWNPITGCTLASAGCNNCYAALLAATRMKTHPSRAGLARMNAAGVAKFTGEVRFNEQWLDQPLRWKKPRGIFVCAHGDLFAPGVPDEWIDLVFAVMALAPQHVFFVLTKRPERARSYLNTAHLHLGEMVFLNALRVPNINAEQWRRATDRPWPLPNVWLGTSIEDQTTADKRIPELLETPAAIRFVSAEPLLKRIDFTTIATGYYFIDALRGVKYHDAPEGVHSATEPCAALDWGICGGESGPNARPMSVQSARLMRDQFARARVPFFFKQWGEWGPMYTPPGTPLRRTPLQRDTPFIPDLMDPEFSVARFGKKHTGRLLDGVEHNAMPEVAS